VSDQYGTKWAWACCDVFTDVWIDVQRQWVYLEGIFSGSADIKHLLPMESARFQNINTEFLTVMKKVYKSPFVLDVMNQPGIQKSLERLADLLNKIQKALGEYLERERASFPRFYFVGDEDLLEIIGNSKDILRIMKHLKKMFAGISTIILDDDLTQILGMASREGEEVRFKEPISLKDYPKINDWLTKLESEMRRSLAVLYARAYLSSKSSMARVWRWTLHDMDGEVSRSTGHTRYSGRLDGCGRRHHSSKEARTRGPFEHDPKRS
jgi:dynein heavy chain 1